MSVRAYKVIEFETRAEAAFNLWRDEEVVQLLRLYEHGLNDDGAGIIELNYSEISEALKQAKQPESIKILTRMRKDAKSNGWVQYYCM